MWRHICRAICCIRFLKTFWGLEDFLITGVSRMPVFFRHFRFPFVIPGLTGDLSVIANSDRPSVILPYAIPQWVLSVSKKLFLHLRSHSVSTVWHYILWKCFSQVLSRKCGSFLYSRTIRNNTHFRIDTCGGLRSAYPYPISIRVWVLCRLLL